MEIKTVKLDTNKLKNKYYDMYSMLSKIFRLMENTQGVAGYHLNDKIAKWQELDIYYWINEFLDEVEGWE